MKIKTMKMIQIMHQIITKTKIKIKIIKLKNLVKIIKNSLNNIILMKMHKKIIKLE